jgi:hypothetical protein
MAKISLDETDLAIAENARRKFPLSLRSFASSSASRGERGEEHRP